MAAGANAFKRDGGRGPCCDQNSPQTHSGARANLELASGCSETKSFREKSRRLHSRRTSREKEYVFRFTVMQVGAGHGLAAVISMGIVPIEVAGDPEAGFVARHALDLCRKPHLPEKVTITTFRAPLRDMAIEAFLLPAAADSIPVPPDMKSAVFRKPAARNLSR